jgi:hypothetical protein
MSRATNHRAIVRRDRFSTTTTVQHAPMQDDLMPPRTWVRASIDLFRRKLSLSPDAHRVFTVLVTQMTMDSHKVRLTHTRLVELANELADTSENDGLHELRMLTVSRVSRAAAQLATADIATFSKKGSCWTVNPTMLQFGNVLNDPALAAMHVAGVDDDLRGNDDDLGLRDFTEEERRQSALAATLFRRKQFELGDTGADATDECATHAKPARGKEARR